MYPTTPLTKDSFLTLVNNLPKELLNKIEDTLKGSHINTYTLTKSMAESVISEYNDKIPLCIVRPSGISAAILEPYPGWLRGGHGVTSIIIRMGYKRLCSIVGDENSQVDVIPIDTVVNTFIASAWANTFRRYITYSDRYIINYFFYHRSSTVQVYNCTSGQSNPIKLKDLLELTHRYRNNSGLKCFPKLRLSTNMDIHKMLVYIFHYPPAYFYDLILRVQGSNPTMVRAAKKLELDSKIGK